MKFPKYPKVKKKNFESWNDMMFIKYNNERIYKHPNRIIRYIEKKRVQAILKYLSPIEDNDKILAAGCGEGYIESHIQGSDITLVDISKHAIASARNKIGTRKGRKFLVANLEDLPLKDKTFSKVECSEVIEHVYDPEALLKELSRVAKDCGVLVISFPNEPLINNLKRILIRVGIFGYFFPDIPVNMLEEWHLRSMDLKAFQNLAKAHWDIIEVSPIPFSILPIRYVVFNRKKTV